MIGFVRFKQNYIVERWEGVRSLSSTRRVAVFVHHDRAGRVHDYVVYYIRQLVESGFEVIFVSNSPRIAPDSLSVLRSYCALVLRRRNAGRDFGAYRDGLSAIADLTLFDEIILANDSVYGPFCALGPLLAQCDESAAVWGITDSWERRFHLQSYFFLLKRAAFTNTQFVNFWRKVRYFESRRVIIRRYEIGFTQAMLRAGLRCTALFPYRRAAAAVSAMVLDGQLLRDDLAEERRAYLQRLFLVVERGIPLNSSHVFWDYLIGELGCPFLKRDLLVKNPMKVPFVNQWEALLSRATQYDTAMIVRHLEVVLNNRSI